jgi:biotin carboxyl carrier protein
MAAEKTEKKKDTIPSDIPVVDCEKLKCKTLNLEGTLYRTLLSRKFETKKPWSEPDPKKIRAFIPGTVSQVLVKVGDHLKAGDDMVIFEAMKMQNRLKTLKDSTVKSVHVKEGDKVTKGFVMVELK